MPLKVEFVWIVAKQLLKTHSLAQNADSVGVVTMRPPMAVLSRRRYCSCFSLSSTEIRAFFVILGISYLL